MARVRMNRGEPQVKFLSKSVGDVNVDNPDGFLTGDIDNLDCYARHDDPPYRVYGAMSGTGKELIVNTGTGRTKLKDGPA